MTLLEYGDPVLVDGYRFTYVGTKRDKSVLISRFDEDLVMTDTSNVVRIFTKQQALEALAKLYQTDTSKITIR